MDLRSGDTIYALASGSGRCAVAVVRLSGPAVRFVLETMAGGLPPPRRLVRRRLVDPSSLDPLDDALVVFFEGPASFTGEDCAELHLHGGTAVRTGVLSALAPLTGCRPAAAGEFTRRALLNGKMDLAAVEGLADLVDAETSLQRRQALRQLDGVLGQAVTRWSDRLLEAMALCEAAIDFADEGDVGEGWEAAVLARVDSVRLEAEEALRGASRGERIRDGYRVAITGPVNAGKSSLLNALAGREAAIVSDIPGTTRDAIELRMDLDGLPVTLIDTAGLRPTDDPIESLGIARAQRIAEDADLILRLSPLSGGVPEGPGLKIGTKADLGGDRDGWDAVVSSMTGEGLEDLVRLVRGMLDGGDEDAALITRARHRVALCEMLACLERARLGLSGLNLELPAEDLRLAIRALGQITGRVGVDDVLDRIFSRFCIGK